MMHGREKSDSAIVAVKPTNKVVSATAEPVEPRAGAKGNASQQSTLRTQCRKCVSQALERIRQVRRHSPKVGAVCGNSARTDLGGGRSVMTVPTALRMRSVARLRGLRRFTPTRLIGGDAGIGASLTMTSGACSLLAIIGTGLSTEARNA